MTLKQAFVLGYAAAYQHGRAEPLSDSRLNYLSKLADADWEGLTKTDVSAALITKEQAGQS